MWDTSQGTRTLQGDEAHLLRELVHYLHDQVLVGIDIGESHVADVCVFDRLQPTQQLVVLHEVAAGLLDPACPPITLTAVREATIYAMFRELQVLIEAEIRFADQCSKADLSLRKLCMAVWCQGNIPPDETGARIPCDDSFLTPPMDPDCDCVEKWIGLIDEIADTILWDRDFDFEDLVGDESPEHADMLKLQMGIDNDYYSTVVCDILDGDVAALSERISRLTPRHEGTAQTQRPNRSSAR